MFAEVEDLVTGMRRFTCGFDFSSVARCDALELYRRLVELERLASAAKNLAADRMADCRAWWDSAYRSPAHLMAAAEARPVNQSAVVLGAVEMMHHLPKIKQAYRQGALNDEQAVEAVSAAQVAPELQEHVLSVAEGEALIEFRRECARIRAGALSEEQRQKRAHQSRRLRHWVDLDGAFRLSGRFSVAAGAQVLAALEPYRQKVADRASRRGRRGKISAGAALADALVEMARVSAGSAEDPMRPGPRVCVHVRLDHAALVRGETQTGEVCEVPGVGPVPVSVVKQWMSQPDAYVAAILTDGQDIRKVVRVGRTAIPARLERALRERDQCCVVPGCAEMQDLETDHVIEVARGGPTTLYNLCRLCAWHHHLKTHRGYVLKRRRGHWLWEYPGGIPPDLDDLQQELSAAGYTGSVTGPG